MTTKPLLLPFLALFLTATAAMASGLGHASPAGAVNQARDIAIGVVQVSRTNGLQVRFTPQTVLKGDMQPGSTYIVDYDTDRNRRDYAYVMPQIAAYAEGKPAVLFLGRLGYDGRTLVPNSLEGAIWPRERKDTPMHQTPDTLEECITFVKALLANPKLKLKHVDERRVLPDGYTLPANNAGAAEPDDDTKALAYRAPAVAVRSATDIAVGAVQVNRVKEVASAQVYRNNGLEIKFTPQTVLKGGMQPGATYNVDYPLGRMSIRDYLPMVAAAVKDKPEVMLLGRLHADGKTFELEGLDSAVWPRSAKWGGVYQTPDTLEGCVTFVKALVANPKLKLKIVNDRQMLPDDYTPPAAVPKAP